MSSITKSYSFPTGNTNPEVILNVEGDTLVSIAFGKRPKLTPSQQKDFKGSEACHRIGLPILKQEIRNAYTGRTFPGATPFLKERHIVALGNRISEEWRKRVRDEGNLFRGDALHNNFAGKLCMLLQEPFQKGKEAFEKQLRASKANPPCVNIVIPTGHRIGANDTDGYQIVRETLGAHIIQLTSWEELCEWFFAANYDESQPAIVRKTEASIMSFFGAAKGSVPRKADLESEARAEAMCRFKAAFKLNTEQPAAETAESTVVSASKKRRVEEVGQ